MITQKALMEMGYLNESHFYEDLYSDMIDNIESFNKNSNEISFKETKEKNILIAIHNMSRHQKQLLLHHTLNKLEHIINSGQNDKIDKLNLNVQLAKYINNKI